MAMTKLTPEKVKERLGEVQGWELEGDTIRRRYAFADFKAAMTFVNRVASAADRADHHPDILIEYNKVTLALSTHDAGGLTERDFALAKTIDAG
jgi:4a-hydroxytetrahydrobiopterin dehydratase